MNVVRTLYTTSIAFAFRAHPITFIPCLTKSCATALPIPELAPVTRATRPAHLFIVSSPCDELIPTFRKTPLVPEVSCKNCKFGIHVGLSFETPILTLNIVYA